MSRLMLTAAVVPFLLAANGVSLLATGPDASAPLSQADIQRVVQQGAGSLKQTCWRPDGGGLDVRVLVHMVIAPTGRVQSTSSSGNDASVAKCVESVIDTWTFPSSSGSTSVDIPFHFVAN
jgi:hypothetical protein